MFAFNLWTARVAVFGWVLFCSLLVLGLSANTVSETNKTFSSFGVSGTVSDYVSLSLAVSIISLLAFTPMLVIDFIRRGAVTSWVVVESGVLGLMWILWVAAAGSAADTGVGDLNCSAIGSIGTLGFRRRDFIAGSKAFCQQQQAMMAFAWLAWLAIFGYLVALLVFAVIAHRRGNTGVWKSTVRDTDFLAPSAASKNSVPMTQPTYGHTAPSPGYSTQNYTGHSYTGQA